MSSSNSLPEPTPKLLPEQSRQLPAPLTARPVAREKRRWFDALDQWVLLALPILVTLIAAALRVDGEHYVEVRGLEFTLPGTCTWRMLFGADCPGCGLTRSFVSLVHGQLWQAFRFNPAGPVLFAVLISQIPYRAGQLWRYRTGRPLWKLQKVGWLVAVALVAIIFMQWFVRIVASV